MKMFFTVAANEDFELRKIYIRAAFLRAKQLERDVFMKPPKDIKKEKTSGRGRLLGPAPNTH